MSHFSNSIRCIGFWLACITCLLPAAQAQESGALSWPSPPDTARIQYLGMLSRGSDIGAERSFLGKIWDAIIGSEREIDFLVQPVGIAVDAGGRIFISDPGSGCVHVFDRAEEEYERIVRGPENAMATPVGIAVSGSRIYVTDAALKQVFVFDEDLDAEFSFPTGMTRPTGIAIVNDRIYICDTGEHRIGVFDLEGKPAGGFGARGSDAGEFNFPVFLAASNELFVVDALNHRVQVLDSAGTPRRMFGTLGTVQGTFASPKGLALDSDRHVYVADALFDAIQIFDGEGQLLLVVGKNGNGPGEFQSPSGICIDAHDILYVVDTLNRRVQLFQYFEKPE